MYIAVGLYIMSLSVTSGRSVVYCGFLHK